MKYIAFLLITVTAASAAETTPISKKVVMRGGIVYAQHVVEGKAFLGGSWFTAVPEGDRAWNSLTMTSPAEYCTYIEGTENYEWVRENFGDYYGTTQLDIFNNYYMPQAIASGGTEDMAIRQMTMDFLGADGYNRTVPVLDTPEGKATFVSEIETINPQTIHNLLSFSSALFYPRDNHYAAAVVAGYARNPGSDPDDIVDMLSLLSTPSAPPLEIDMRNSHITRDEIQAVLDNRGT